ncbi:MAG: ATP-binding protein [Pseudomonadota bacterium]|nr:ATP-binding protein [Pseudomonadota bacterium]
MIKEIRLNKWKSFSDATLFVDSVTVLIGTNASGKSNALDALLFLKRISTGMSFTAALQGDQSTRGIRGGLEWASLDKNGKFSIEAKVEGSDERTDYVYRVECVVEENRCDLVSESLQRLKYRSARRSSGSRPYSIFLFSTDACASDAASITARLYNEKRGSPRPSLRSLAVIHQLAQQPTRKEIEAGIRDVLTAFRHIFVLDPIPAHMRDYSPLSDQLEPDASNIAGVIAALPGDDQKRLEDQLSKYGGHLPERDIRRIYAEPVGKFRTDAMLYCDEQWSTEGGVSSVDARGMSDGTLRFLAILTSLLTRPANSLLVVEEVDNGLHPSRVGLLLEMLTVIGEQRGIDVLVTTHNPAFLDAAGPGMVPFITVSHRDPKTGASRLTLLEDIEQLPKLLASGAVGKLSSEGRIERALVAQG